MRATLTVALGMASAVLACRTRPERIEAAAPASAGEVAGPSVPRIDAKPIPRIPIKVEPRGLPEGARARFPAFDGDRFVVSLPPKAADALAAQQVLEAVVAPVLRAMGFTRSLGEFAPPPAEGVRMPVGNLKELAQVSCLGVSEAQFRAVPQALATAKNMCAALTGDERATTPATQEALRTATGMTLAQFRADVERKEIQYPFRQLVQGVPIEHVLVLASRLEGQTVSSVSGSFLNRFVVVNRAAIAAEDAARRGPVALKGIAGITAIRQDVAPPPVVLVLLPYGAGRDAAGATVPALHYAYRMTVQAAAGILQGPWQLWLDAESGQILQLYPLVHFEAAAQGRTYRRAPDTLSIVDPLLVPMRVDDASAGRYVLRLSGVMNQVAGPVGQVAISSSTAGSSATFANFDQPTNGINDAGGAICEIGSPTLDADDTFQQVSVYGTLYKARAWLVYGGIFTPFPPSAFGVTTGANFCNAFGSLGGFTYGACPGNPSCPDVGLLNAAHDNTVVLHELGHAVGPYLGSARPANWCGSASCSVPSPSSHGLFHDFADFLADAVENTNCFGGWWGKNALSPSDALNCVANTSEGGWVPRLHAVTVPFDPASPGDHFPEHRALATGDYADGQIAAAALWLVREGLLSKSFAAGPPQFMVRWVRATRQYGFLTPTCSGCDSDIYRYLLDLETNLLGQWIASGTAGGPPVIQNDGPASSNKVTAGFAKAGVFLIPQQCIDGDTTTSDPLACPTGENGGDAVVDVDDNDTTDDITVLGASHLPIREVDYLKQSGGPPSFHVWTGPRYRFDASGNRTFPTPAPCNTQFQVEAASDDGFTTNFTVSGFVGVSTNPATQPQCYGSWTLPVAAWNAIRTGPRIYYRVRTRDAAGANERLSTSPAAGLYTVPPPYAVINASGSAPPGGPPVVPTQLTVSKVLVPPSDPGRFDILIDGTVRITAAGNNATTGAMLFQPGTHTVSENAAGTTVGAQYSTQFQGDCAPSGAVTLAPGDTKTCTIVNTARGDNCTVVNTKLKSPKCRPGLVWCPGPDGQCGCRKPTSCQ